MEIIGKWKVAEANVMDMKFKQTWRLVEDMLADASVNPMQKAMARTVYQFNEDGTALQLAPKELDEGGEYEAFDDSYVIGNSTHWKEENGRLYIAAEENGEDDWIEMIPDGKFLTLFNMHRIAKI